MLTIQPRILFRVGLILAFVTIYPVWSGGPREHADGQRERVGRRIPQ